MEDNLKENNQPKTIKSKNTAPGNLLILNNEIKVLSYLPKFEKDKQS